MIVIVMLTSCGTRKVQSEISKQTQKEAQEQRSESSKENVQQSESESVTRQENDKTDETTETSTTTKYDKDGKPTETTTTTKTGKSTDKSKSQSKVINNNYLRTIEKMNVLTVTNHTKVYYSKEKQVDTDRNGLYWTIGAVLLGVALLYGVYRYITRKR